MYLIFGKIAEEKNSHLILYITLSKTATAELQKMGPVPSEYRGFYFQDDGRCR